MSIALLGVFPAAKPFSSSLRRTLVLQNNMRQKCLKRTKKALSGEILQSVQRL